jgi:hypothetical protein
MCILPLGRHDIEGGMVLEHNFVLAALGLQDMAACELCLEPHGVFSITPNSRSSKETSTRLWLGLGEVGLLEGKIRC